MNPFISLTLRVKRGITTGTEKATEGLPETTPQIREDQFAFFVSEVPSHPEDLQVPRWHWLRCITRSSCGSVGDVLVSIIRWTGGYRRYIRIKHNNMYATGYGPLNRFIKAVKKGSRVWQADVIGYVGSSGLATGCHIDFTIMRRGRYVNPLNVQSAPAARLTGKDRERFDEVVVHLEDLWQKRQAS